jgi:hypothetical protein
MVGRDTHMEAGVFHRRGGGQKPGDRLKKRKDQ